MKDQSRNLNPHKPAIAAMYIYGDEYAAKGVGSMDFWDQVGFYKQNVCRDLVETLEKAPHESAPEEEEDRTVSDYPWTEHIYDESRPNPGRRNSRMALAAASALASVPEPWPIRREHNPGATGSSNTKQSQRKSKRRAKGKAQRRARRKNRSR